MAFTYQIHSIIAPAASANTTAYTYTEIYAGANATPTINGVDVVMAAGTSLYLKVQTISATANVYVLGEKIDVSYDNPIIIP